MRLKNMNATEAIRYIDTCFRDYAIRFREVEYDREARKVRIPVIAPDPERRTFTRFLRLFSRSTERFVKWWIEIRCVQDLAIEMSEPVPDLAQIEFGSVRFLPPDKVIISGQYVLSIEVEVDDLDVHLSHEHLVLFEVSRVGLTRF